MRRIHELDVGLQEAFERGAQENGVAFIHTDPSNRVVPCSPNKILLSSTTTLRPHKRLLPIGFQTEYKTKVEHIVRRLDARIDSILGMDTIESPFLINIQDAKALINDISETFAEEAPIWDNEAFNASMEYLSRFTQNQDQMGKVWCLVRKNRNASRLKQDGSYYDAPDTAQTEGQLAKETAIDIPMLMLFRQNGLKEQGWRGCPFWWPVLMVPRNAPTVVYSGAFSVA